MVYSSTHKCILLLFIATVLPYCFVSVPKLLVMFSGNASKP
jgi:hypothetical protein